MFINNVTKKVIVCLVVNQLLNTMPDYKTRLAIMLGQDPESLEIDLLPETISVAGIAIVWQAVSSVLDWRVLIAATAAIVAIYYLSNRVQEDLEVLNDFQLNNVSKKLLG